MDPRTGKQIIQRPESSKPILIPNAKPAVNNQTNLNKSRPDDGCYVGSPDSEPTTPLLLKHKNFAEFLRQRECLFGNKQQAGVQLEAYSAHVIRAKGSV